MSHLVRHAQTAVVTGGAGFIGSHLVDALLARGDRVFVVDDLSTGRRDRVPRGAHFVLADVRDPETMRLLSLRIGPATWFHLAAQASVRRSVAAPLDDSTVNVFGTISVLEAARATGSDVVFASTGGAIYGPDAPHPSDEFAAAEPLSPYGAAKLAAEGYVATWARLHGMRNTILRFANVYGPRQDPHGEAGVVAIFAGCMRDGRAVTIYGTGEQRRDYVYVGDAVAALLAAADGTDRTGTAHRFNVGTGVATSVNELWAAMQRITGHHSTARRAPRRPGELDVSVLDATRAREELSVPLNTPLADGLAITLASVGVTPVNDKPHLEVLAIAT